jgi:WD40 repeat protein
MDKLSKKYWIIFGMIIAFLFISCQGVSTSVPISPTMTKVNTPTPFIPTSTLGPVEHIWATILTQAASTTVEPPTLQVDNSIPIPIKYRLGKGTAYAAAISPDGRTIAVTRLFSVSTYDFNSLKEIWTSPMEQVLPWPYGDITWSPDGSQLATLSGTGVSVWNAKTGEQLHIYKRHSYNYSSIAWTREGKLVASAYNLDNKHVLLWDVQTGEELVDLGGASSYAWMPHEDLLALGIGFKEISIWDIAANKQLYFPMKACDSYCLERMEWSSDGKMLASSVAGIKNQVLIWNVQTGEQLYVNEIPVQYQVLTMAWSPDNSYLAAALANGMIIVWDESTGKQLHSLKGSQILSLDWSPDGKNLITLSQYESIIIWDIQTGEPLRSLDERTSRVLSLAWSPSGDLLGSGSEDGEVILWASSDGKKLLSFHDSTGSVSSLAWSPDGKQLASGGHKITIWEAQTGKQIQVLQASTEEAFKVAWSPDGSKLASISFDGQGSIWDAYTGEKLLNLKNNLFSQYIAWSPQGNLLGTSYPDPPGEGREQVTLWSTQTGEAVLTQPGLYNLAWSPMGNTIASVWDNGTLNLGDDKTIVLWDARTGSEIRRINADVFQFAWSPNGEFLVVSGNPDNSLGVVVAQTGEKIYNLKGHANLVTEVAWSPRGDLIASASQDGTVIIWEANVH